VGGKYKGTEKPTTILPLNDLLTLKDTKVIQKVSSDKKKKEFISKPLILPFEVHTVHYF
jgi:hypothetical protein